MRTKKFKVFLTDEERKELTSIVKRGKHSASTVKRANILLNLDENTGPVDEQTAIAKRLCTNTTTIYLVSRQFVTEGLSRALHRKKRDLPPRQPIVTGDIEARLLATACSRPPEGRSRWTLRLLERTLVELNVVETISDSTIYRVLKKRNISLTCANIGAFR